MSRSPELRRPYCRTGSCTASGATGAAKSFELYQWIRHRNLPGVHRAQCARRQRPQSFDRRRNDCNRAIYLVACRGATQAESQTRPRFIRRQTDGEQHVRRLDGSRRTRRTRRARDALEIERDDERFAVRLLQKPNSLCSQRDGRGLHSHAPTAVSQSTFLPGGREESLPLAHPSRDSFSPVRLPLPKPTIPGTFSVPGRRSRS